MDYLGSGWVGGNIPVRKVAMRLSVNWKRQERKPVLHDLVGLVQISGIRPKANSRHVYIEAPLQKHMPVVKYAGPVS